VFELINMWVFELELNPTEEPRSKGRASTAVKKLFTLKPTTKATDDVEGTVASTCPLVIRLSSNKLAVKKEIRK
jgi:hypothetical protein